MSGSRFYTKEEIVEHQMRNRRARLEDFPVTTYTKVYPGARMYAYHLNLSGELFIDNVFLVTDVSLSSLYGAEVKLIDEASSDLKVVRESPTHMRPLEVLLHTPPRVTFERTIRETWNGHLQIGMTSAIACRSKSDPNEKVSGHTQVQSITKINSIFSSDDVDFAMARWEAGM